MRWEFFRIIIILKLYNKKIDFGMLLPLNKNVVFLEFCSINTYIFNVIISTGILEFKRVSKNAFKKNVIMLLITKKIHEFSTLLRM